MQNILVADLGGSALKAGLYSSDGDEIATARTAISFDEDSSGRSEQNASDWWSALEHACFEISEQTGSGFSDVAAVAICGFTRSQVFLDSKNRVLRPAMTFRDSRANMLTQQLLSYKQLADHADAKHFNAYHPLARLLWLRENEPSIWAAVHTIIEPKDYLNFRLTGYIGSDHISQYWLKKAISGTAPTMASLTGIDCQVLPSMSDPFDEIGRVLAGLSAPMSTLAGARVFCGSHDTWTAALGMGALHPGRAYCMSGSSEVIGMLTSKEAKAEGLINLPWGKNLWQIGGPGSNGASALNWIIETLSPPNGLLSERLADLLSIRTNSAPLIFCPYLHGERTPFWDRDLRAAFLGLTGTHSAGDMIVAVMEGVAFLNRLVLERAEMATRSKAIDLRLAGGGAGSPFWNQIRANVLNRPILVSTMNEVGLAGCLSLARGGLGLSTELQDGPMESFNKFTRFEPEPNLKARYDALYAVFLEANRSIAQISHSLAELARSHQ